METGEMKLVAITLVPAFRFGGGEKWQLECLKELLGSFQEVRYLAVAADLPPSGKVEQTTFRRYDFACEEWGEEIGWCEVDADLAEATHVWIFQYQASDISVELILNANPGANLFFTNLGCEPAPFFKAYVPAVGHRFVEISRFAAMRTSRFVSNVDHVWCGYEAGKEISPVAKAEKEGFVMVGRMLPHKRPDFLVREWKKGDPVLRLVGGCPDAGFLERLVATLADKPVEIHPEATDLERDRIISRSLGLIAPSSMHPEQSELLGLVVFEALQCGTIPVTSSIPAYVEIMEALDLSDWVFAWDSPEDLRHTCQRLQVLPGNDYLAILEHARDRARRQFRWSNIVPLIARE